jgi:ABC-type glycerol-3-phosphate transport system substrate-binding protein
MIRSTRLMVGLAALALVVGACGSAASPSPSSVPATESPATPAPASEAPASAAPSMDTTPVTIVVWDYYGEATPIKPALDGFQKEYPWITVKYEALDWDSMNEKFAVGVAAGAAPDVATLDMTWIPTLASNGVLEDLSALSGGMLNGTPIADQFEPGGNEAMQYDGTYVTMLFDFDAYALYYRADQFEKKGIAVPANWDELRAAAKALAEDTNGDGKPDKYLYQVWPDTFHWAQFLFQNGGSILTADNTAAAFNSSEGVASLEFNKGFIDDGSGMYWGPDQGDQMAFFKDDTLGMFQNGPYMMGVLKSGAPEMAGKWRVATAPYSKQPGSYLGGTGLGIPVAAANKQAAWTFIQYMLLPEQQIGVYTYAGAAPATTVALQSPEVSAPDPYFGDQAPFPIFLDTMKTATHFPYVKAWSEIQTPTIDDAVAAALLGQASAKDALDNAAEETNSLLKK